MISDLVFAVGLVAVFEGLVLALAPRKLEDALKMLLVMSPDTRRGLGLAVIAAGVLVAWAARKFLY